MESSGTGGGDAVPTKAEVPKEKQGRKKFGRKNKDEEAVNAEETLNPIASGEDAPPEWSAHTWSTLGSDLKQKKKEKAPPAQEKESDEVGEAV